MSVLDALRGLYLPSEQRSLALIAAELRQIRRLLEIQHREAGHPLPVSDRDAKRHKVDDSGIPSVSEDQEIEVEVTKRYVERGAKAVEDEEEPAWDFIP